MAIGSYADMVGADQIDEIARRLRRGRFGMIIQRRRLRLADDLAGSATARVRKSRQARIHASTYAALLSAEANMPSFWISLVSSTKPNAVRTQSKPASCKAGPSIVSTQSFTTITA